MKKILSFFIFLLFTVCMICPQSEADTVVNKKSKLFQVNAQTKRIPAGTHLKLKLVDSLSTEINTTGDAFELNLMNDQKVDGIMVLPVGSGVRGSVSKIRKSSRLSKSGLLYLSFDHIINVTGKQVPLAGSICNVENLTYDGGITGGGNYLDAVKRDAKKSGEIIKTVTLWGWEKGDNIANGYPKYIFVPFTAIGGALGGSSYFVGSAVVDLFKKGEPVILEQGDIIEIQLAKPLDIPLY